MAKDQREFQYAINKKNKNWRTRLKLFEFQKVCAGEKVRWYQSAI